ncbi:MAG: OmpA family protein [Candidatus Omnitrophica bacterium]|nr:OmpA family protein [Candidatus Omnitrophota bacterium]
MLSGCAVKFAQRSSWDIQQIQTLSEQLEQFRTLAQLKSEEAQSLRQAKSMLDQRLSSPDISVGFDERGLIVRVLDTVLFDSGKAKLRKEAYAVLEQVASVLNKEAVDQPIAVEGHTDNEPIKHSGWKDNWELSLARARSVLTYLVQERRVAPARVSTVGYGEYRPIASNETPEGRRANRRVEIVVLPRGTTVQGPADSREAARGASAYRK